MSDRRSNPRRAAASGAAAALTLLMAAGAMRLAAAQPSPGPPGLLAADEEMVQKLLKARSTADLATELDMARRREESARVEYDEATRMATVASGRVEVKESEIALIKERIKLAKKEKDDATRNSLERLRADEEKHLSLFRAMREAADANRERSQAALEFARSRIALQEAEMDLAQRREARMEKKAASSAVEAEQLDREIHEASRRTLSALRDYAKTGSRMSDRTDRMAKARLELLDLWETSKGR